jgi:ADP-ribose pyrophosphatase YjhB (NUDIX family)
MKIDFPLPTDGKMHRYCFSCLVEGAEQVRNKGRTKYHCDACGKDNVRALYFDQHKVWLDESKELWHESAGVFVRRKDGKFLFFKRTEFPRLLTVPAGHVDRWETPLRAAGRELVEETGITGKPRLLGRADIVGDSCSAGADAHVWHAYVLDTEDPEGRIKILEEGEEPLWLTLDEAKEQEPAFVIGRIIDMFRSKLR